MKQLKIEYLAPYLPYDLEILVKKGKDLWVTEAMRGITQKEWHVHPEYGTVTTVWGDSGYPINGVSDPFVIKPFLFPLSDLTKEIYHNGEKFIPSKRIFEEGYGSYTLSCAKDHIEGISFGFMQRLIEWHFDVFGLIEQNLAIDINSL